MRTRLDFHEMLETVTECSNVYYQPPKSLMMRYPAIVYYLDDIDNIHANDKVYLQLKPYMVTVIDKNPESEIVDVLSKLNYSAFDRTYVADNLHHTVFTIYY